MADAATTEVTDTIDTAVDTAIATAELPGEAEVEIPEGLLPTVFTGSLCPSNDY